MERERCIRCAAEMEWRHSTWQCPVCRYKLGCCEGPTGECYSEPEPVSAAERSSRSR